MEIWVFPTQTESNLEKNFCCYAEFHALSNHQTALLLSVWVNSLCTSLHWALWKSIHDPLSFYSLYFLHIAEEQWMSSTHVLVHKLENFWGHNMLKLTPRFFHQIFSPRSDARHAVNMTKRDLKCSHHQFSYSGPMTTVQEHIGKNATQRHCLNDIILPSKMASLVRPRKSWTMV